MTTARHLYFMVVRSHCARLREKPEDKFRFATKGDLDRCILPILLYRCAPISELLSKISENVLMLNKVIIKIIRTGFGSVEME